MFTQHYKVVFNVGSDIVFRTEGTKSPQYAGNPFDTIEVLDSAIEAFRRAVDQGKAPVNALERTTHFVIEDPMTRKLTRYDRDDIARMRADTEILRRQPS